MKRLVTIVIMLVGLVTHADTNDWSVTSVTNKSTRKIHIFIGGGDGYWGHDVLITDFTPSPPTIKVVVPQSRHIGGVGNGRFRVYQSLTAVLSNSLTHATETVRITNRQKDIIRLGTNDFWVVDIRKNTSTVLLKNVRTGKIITLERQEGEHHPAPYPEQRAVQDR